jgi:hypothetical protein
MKYILTLALLATLASCSKDSDKPLSKERTLTTTVQEFKEPNSGDYYWNVRLTFNPQVTIQGSVTVDFDVYYMGAFSKHYTEKINFQLKEKNTVVHNTSIRTTPWGQGDEVKNIKTGSLVQTSGDYIITIK